jgi:hypothetical protein
VLQLVVFETPVGNRLLAVGGARIFLFARRRPRKTAIYRLERPPTTN